MDNKIIKHVLENGMTVLVRPCHGIPKVSVQLWYNVGSKDEQTGEKGLAHLIEHMIFKGTDKLSESDINDITHKLSGSCNAFTSYDYTGYLFDFPSQHWYEALPIMADCMRNCTFKTDLLNSELKAVVQELKMYRDDYRSTLVEELLSVIFPDHPYHHPIIGYKQDLWNLTREALVNFYKKHYQPNNATLIIVGDTKVDTVLELAKKYFSSIKSDPTYTKQGFYLNNDIVSRSVTLHRDIQQPNITMAWVVPGTKAKMDYVIDVMSWILGAGKGSRLYKKLVDELSLVTDVAAFNYDLFDHGVFFVEFQPKKLEDTDKIIDIIHQEIADIIKNKLKSHELVRACKQTENEYLSLLENNQKQAYFIGKFFVANGDENALFDYIQHDKKKLEQDVYELFVNYFRQSVTHYGKLLPLHEDEKKQWLLLQDLSDKEDAKILSGKERKTSVEPAVIAKQIVPKSPESFEYPTPNIVQLDNGIKLFYHDSKHVQKIEILLSLKTKYVYDPEDKQGISSFMSALLVEGTKKHTAIELAQEFESLGMGLSLGPGYILLNMLTPDFKKGLSLFQEILTESVFDKDAVERVRAKIIADVKNYWDSPVDFASDVVRSNIYKGHPYHKSKIGTLNSISSITRDDLFSWYKKSVVPFDAKISIVGDLSDYNVADIVNDAMGKWNGEPVSTLKFPELSETESKEITHHINRDQVVLCFAGKSISRLHPDYDKLLLFDQIFGGGVLGSMSSRLFQLREQTGLFYTIGGSLLYGSDEQPGMTYVRTIVSLDRLQEAENAIKKTIETVADSITQEEFEQARNALINSLVDVFASNRKTASAFLSLDKYNLPSTYFDTRPQDFMKLTLDDVKKTAKKYLDINKLAVFKIGRVK